MVLAWEMSHASPLAGGGAAEKGSIPHPNHPHLNVISCFDDFVDDHLPVSLGSECLIVGTQDRSLCGEGARIHILV